MMLTEVQADVVKAYGPWMLQKKKEVMDYFNNPDTPAHYKEYVVLLFQQLDKDGSGIVNLDELLAWAAEKNPHSGSKVPDEFIAAQFSRVDLDNSGGLDFEECLLLQYLGCLNMLWCSSCGAFIDSAKEDAYTCTTCYGKFGPKGYGLRQHDLCVQCHNSGKAEEHIETAGTTHSFVHMSEIKLPETVVCDCCKQEHGMVLGYLQGGEGDRHVRPHPDDPERWLCELCALSACKCGQKLGWQPAGAKVGGLFNDRRLGHEGGCAEGQPLGSLKERWIKASSTRMAPHCTGCKESLLDGTMPFPVEPPPRPPPPPLEVATQDMAAATLAAAAPVAVAAAVVAPPVVLGAKQVVCYCCQDVHDLTSALDGAQVKGYLYASGFAEHVKDMGNGQYLCEWCAKYICEKCGTHYSSSDQPKLAKWSKLMNCPPDECCEATKWGGLVSVKAGIRKKADDMARGHCRACRHKIITESLLDLSAPPPARQSDAGAAVEQTRASPGAGTPMVQAQVVCFCCQEIHDVTSALGSKVPAYMPKDDFPDHTKDVGGDKFVCEFCAKWKCHKCGALKWTDTRPEIGLWSESSYYCKNGCKPKEGGPHIIEKASLRAMAHDLSRSHCRVCREKIIMGKLVERAPKAPPAAREPTGGDAGAAVAVVPKKQTDVARVLNGAMRGIGIGKKDGKDEGDKKDCTIQ